LVVVLVVAQVQQLDMTHLNAVDLVEVGVTVQ
jgi:hypothetical protein